MLKFGLVLFSVSSVGVVLRSFELVDLAGPTFKMACSLTLVLSVVCFLGTYVTAEYAHSRSRQK